jgi:hypothetical protein
VATQRPRWRIEVARGGTAVLVQRLRDRTLDALVVDVRSIEPAPDLDVTLTYQMSGAFMVRPNHPLARRRAVRFDELRAYPLASIPLSAEVARVLTESYGPQAHPDVAVTLRCEELSSLVDITAQSDTVLLAIRASAPALVTLPMNPPMTASARLGLVRLARRTPPPSLELLTGLMAQRLVDAQPRAARRRAPGA